MEKIKPTTKPEKDEAYELEDRDFLLISAIQELTAEINKLRIKLK